MSSKAYFQAILDLEPSHNVSIYGLQKLIQIN